MKIRQSLRPVGIYFWHVHPGRERPGERVQQSFFGPVDLSHPEDVVDVAEDG